MLRKCPYCHQEMEKDCYLKDQGTVLSDFIVIEKDENYKKTEHVVKAAICKKCGYVELYVDLNERLEK
ncbi:MAG: hypothetical protein U0L85_11600 [Bacilli bacterium]|nr:hypothetical protein [Bacilli bacterium]